MPENKNFVPCYNRGCGQQFDPNNNTKDECRHHPGAPIFHDAYKGWSCCNKKSVDFTEFLNIQGCTLSKHSNVKPPEPEKKVLDTELENKEVIVVRAPVLGPQLTRPPFDTPTITLQPTIAESLKQSVQNISQNTAAADDSKIAVGTSCKNGGCSATYEGPHSNDNMCTYHPGCPIFHEGLKFWSCCQKRTTDFNTFLSQPGCTTGTHKWTKEASPAGTVKCRWDWHQTSEFVIVSVYAKKYDPTLSFVKLNPIRLNTKLVFREQGDAAFELDLELRGVVNIARSSASMFSTKIEIKLKKAEPGAWSKLDFPHMVEKKEEPKQEDTLESDDYEDLSTVEAIGKEKDLLEEKKKGKLYGTLRLTCLIEFFLFEVVRSSLGQLGYNKDASCAVQSTLGTERKGIMYADLHAMMYKYWIEAGVTWRKSMTK